MSAAQGMVRLWWDKWVEALRDKQRRARDADQAALAKRNLLCFVEKSTGPRKRALLRP